MNKEELIEKYFSHQLSEKEFEQLQHYLQDDAELRNEFYQELNIKSAIAQEKHDVLKGRLQNLDKKPSGIPQWYLYAAAIAIFVAIGSLFIDTTSNDYHTLYTENFEVYPNVIDLNTRSDVPLERAESSAFALYDDKKFNEAAITFHELYATNEKDYFKFYEGVSLLANHKISEGITVLESYAWEANESNFSIPAFWYLGLSYMKLENVSESEKWLTKVAHSESQLSASAQQLIETLN
ncbi:tetratricopeptide repeat protein [Winogradskyella sp. SM1960]|uniref:tetratricopeptide repeat protein n=1 Tax=Winogradskyella sp. SM1960 TaxID=2865955 RepID=UPI001CD6808C|nr:hypothetical protein [Winogradskyella sp. SM1960]